MSKEEHEYFDNPFKVCSDEWCDRSYINSVIYCSTSRIEHIEDTIKDYTAYIQKDIDRGFYPNLRCNHVQKWIEDYKKEVRQLKYELSVLKREGFSDKEKIRSYQLLHKHNGEC
jgi:hypothetical protein